MADIVNHPKYQKDRPTVVYIHGWLENGEFQESVMAVRSAYRVRNDHNILVIDWSLFSKWMYPVPYKSSISKLKNICEMIGEQLELIRTRGCDCYKNIYLVGHSLGGQCAGLVGRTVKKLSKGQYIIPRIFALDPAGPGFEFDKIVGVRGFDSISKNDAKYVQVIHTNGGNLGVKKSVGHCDFFVNGGSKQPGCLTPICNHQNSWVYFQESVRDEQSFMARKCDAYHDFLNGYCDKNDIRFMGYSSNETYPMGTYCLRTHPSKYGTSLGKDALSNAHFTLTYQDGSVSSGSFPFSFEFKILNNNDLIKQKNSINNNI
ncbi:phospholipase A1-like isoform X2 [Chironomus tepperi]